MKQYLVGACAVLAISGSSVPVGAVAQTLVNDDSITVDGHVARDGKSVE